MYRNLSPRALGFSGSIQSEMIELALTYGFLGMDLDIADFGQQVADFGLEHARRLIDSARLKIGNFVLPVRWAEDEASYEKDMAKLPNLAKLAADMGCSRAMTVIQPASDKRPYNDNVEFHVKRLGDIGKALEPFGVSLAVEFLGPTHLREGKTHEFIHDLPSTMKLLDMVNRPNVGLLLDTWHVYTSGGTLADIKALPGDKIISVQVSDAPAGAPIDQLQDMDRRLPGETGVIDIPAVLAFLGEVGYDGPITPEPLKQRMKGIGRQRAVKLVGDSLMNSWKASGLPLGIRTVVVSMEEG